MACHICGNNAVGLCRQCFKFYCQEHGDGFCSSCQQQGWQLEQNLKVVGFNTKIAPRVQPASEDKETASEQIAAVETEASKPDDKVEKQRIEGKRQWLDQETIEALTEPAKFVSLLPIFGASKRNDVLMLLKGAELYEEAFAFVLNIAFGSRSDNGMSHRHPTPLDVTIRDDVGTPYNLYHQGGGGSEHEWRENFLVTPAFNPAAKQLTLKVPRLQIMEHIFHGQRRMPPEQTFLNGPWIISCTVPDERISIQ